MSNRCDDKTMEVIAGMLKECTGIAMMDSGGENGRHWQRNQGRDFESEPTVTVSARWGLEVTINLYHWLCDTLTYDPHMQTLFDNWHESNEDSWGSGQENFVTDYLMPESRDDLESGESFVLGGEYTNPFRPTITDNTYNHENAFSQDFIYTIFEIDESPDPMIDTGMYVLLSIHNGADARGGYTDSKVFKVARDHDTEFMDFGTDIALACDHCSTYWTSDDSGYHWYKDGSSRGMGLQDYKLIESGDDSVMAWWTRWLWEHDGMIDYEKIERLTGESDLLVAIDDHTVICPCCGHGVLQAGY
jgi:hypothetical protein